MGFKIWDMFLLKCKIYIVVGTSGTQLYIKLDLICKNGVVIIYH